MTRRVSFILVGAWLFTAAACAPADEAKPPAGAVRVGPSTFNASPGTHPLSTAAPTGFEKRELLLRDDAFKTTVALNSDTVLCSSADYNANFLKVLIPEVANATLFDHRNTSVGAPCIAAGICTATFNEATFLASGGPTEDIDVNVVMIGHYDIDHDTQTCSVWLSEEIFTTIREVDFYHLRFTDISNRAYEDCLGI